MEERKQIGWQLVPIYEAQKGSIVTQAFILCCSCGKAVSANMGPRENAFCMDCVKDEGEANAEGRNQQAMRYGDIAVKLQEKLDGAYGSLREHMARVKELQDQLAKVREDYAALLEKYNYERLK